MADDDIPRRLRIADKLAGIVAAIALPIAIPVATCMYNDSHVTSEAQRSCVELKLKFIAARNEEKATESSDALLDMVDAHNLLDKVCPKDLKTDTAQQAQQVQAAIAKSNDPVATAQALKETTGATAPKPVEAPPPPDALVQARTLSPSSAVLDEATQHLGSTAQQAKDTGLRVFIQIADESERPGAEAIRAKLQKARFGDSAIIAPGVQRVPNSLAKPELRCLKTSDCRKAGDLALFLGVAMGGKTPTVRDLSKRYDSEPGVKPGTFELWFGPGELSS